MTSRRRGSRSTSGFYSDGARDTGAGVSKWQLDEPAHSDGEDVQRRDGPRGVGSSAEVNDDNLGITHCAVCMAELHGEDWGWCYCHTRQCGRCIAAPCTICPVGPNVLQESSTEREAQRTEEAEQRTIYEGSGGMGIRPGHVQQAISIWEGLGCSNARRSGQGVVGAEGSGPPRGDLEEPERVITGWRNGRKIEICNGCQRDYVEGSAIWSTCECGRRRCEACRAEGCSCGRNRKDPSTRGARAHHQAQGRREWWEAGLADAELRDQCVELPGRLESPPSPAGGTGDHGHRCVQCGLRLDAPGVYWRICRCGATACIACRPTPADMAGSMARCRGMKAGCRHHGSRLEEYNRHPDKRSKPWARGASQ